MANNIKTFELNHIIEKDVIENGLNNSPKDSMAEFMNGGINLIVTQFFKIRRSVVNERPDQPDIETIKFEINFTDVKISKPTIPGTNKPMFPAYAHRHDLSYLGPILIDATIKATAYRKGKEPLERIEKIKNFHVASIPIMVRSNMCHTFGLPPQTLRNIGEDPLDAGGYFILGGHHWIIAAKRSRVYNTPAIYHNKGYGNELARLEFISLPGDTFENSAEIKIRLINDNRLIITLTSDKYLKELNIPFFVIFRLMNMDTEKDIVDNIIMDGEQNELSGHMFKVLRNAFEAKYPGFPLNIRFITNTEDLRITLVNALAAAYMRGKTIHDSAKFKKELERTTEIINENLMPNLDNKLFPHHGKGPEHRFSKARYLGLMINKLLKVEQDIIPSSDRDSYVNIAVLDVGTSFSKMFKKEFNKAIVSSVARGFEIAANKTKFTEISLKSVFESSVNIDKLQNRIERSLSTGMGTYIEGGKQVKNRVPSELLHPKNNVNVESSLASIRSESNNMNHQDERSQRMRGVRTSQIGICVIESTATGTNVGMVPTLSIGAKIASASSGEVMKKILLKEKLIVPLEKVMPHHIAEKNYYKVFVNGYWVGCTADISKLFRLYRERRRGWDLNKVEQIVNDDIDHELTIHWDRDEIDFRVDRGRLITPFVVVRNNTDADPVGQKIIGTKFNPNKPETFEQRVAITREQMNGIINGNLKLKDLVKAGCIDYIAAAEVKKCLVARDLEKLEQEKNNPLLRYTHVQIPLTLIGVAVASSPFLANNYQVRSTYQSSQQKQTCGVYANNFMHRFDPSGIVQLSERPMVETFTSRVLTPNGQNAIVAVSNWDGQNEEDANVYNTAAAQRGAFRTHVFEPYKTELHKGEQFGVPQEENTSGIKGYADYSKLDKDGFIKLNSRVVKNDVLVGKKIKIDQTTTGKTFKDTSLIYYGSETGWVVDIVKGVDSRHKHFCKIKLCFHRELCVGEKFSSREGQKGMVGHACAPTDILFTESGLRPTFIISPHSFPSRMTINQPIENLYCKLAAKTGITFDATLGVLPDIESVGDMLESLGYNRYGVERCYDGRTGEPIDAEIYIGSCMYQRLQKFVESVAYSIGSHGPTTFDVRQPTEGRKRNGGPRIGEMEKDTIYSQGATMFISSKFYKNSDGFDVYICKNCGNDAIVNEKQNIYICRTCNELADIVRVPNRFACHLFVQELRSMYIDLKRIPARYERRDT